MTPYKSKPSNKILITLPFWEGDKAQMMDLARLIADLEPEHSDLADILFVNRFDCKQDQKTIDYVSRKFNVSTHRSGRRSTGWPNGPTGIFFGSLERIYSDMLTGRAPGYKAFAVIESDTTPLAGDWIAKMSNEWDRAFAERNGKLCMMGCLIEAEGIRRHINGGASFLSTRQPFLHHLAIRVADCMGGWDYTPSTLFETWGWHNTPLVRSEWQTPTATVEDWARLARDGVALYHGVKDDSMRRMAREILL
jgi:hypothetical protein